MMRRLLDIAAAVVGLIAAGPLLLVCMFLVWRQDRHSPFYVAERVGLDGKPFRMVKLRSMVINADRSGVDSTSGDDRRITSVGHFLRRYKVDELPQLWNVLKGEMSLVGPRPNVKRETDLYSQEERRLLSVRPGITDLASIVFADEGDILAGHADPDLAYNQLIRPWKSRLALLYIDRPSLFLYTNILVLTLLGSFSRERALGGIQRVLQAMSADPVLTSVARRESALYPFPPPGMTSIVSSRSA